MSDQERWDMELEQVKRLAKDDTWEDAFNFTWDGLSEDDEQEDWWLRWAS